MNRKTGEIAPIKEFRRRGLTGTIIKPIDLKDLSPKVREMIEKTGRAWITRNSRCPCGSGKRFKRCCMMK